MRRSHRASTPSCRIMVAQRSGLRRTGARSRRRQDLRTWSVASVDARARAAALRRTGSGLDHPGAPRGRRRRLAPGARARREVRGPARARRSRVRGARHARVCPVTGPRPRGLTSDDRRALDDGIGAHIDHDRARPVRARAGRLPHAHRRRGAQRALVAVGRSQATGPRHGAAARAVPRPGHPGGHQERVRAQRVHRSAPAWWPIPRLACRRRRSSSSAGCSSPRGSR